ncbi:GAF domain-containing protein [Tindallia californiensis]|uniref:GAF domain-containing protein n=1 Tax=Tindallia californiensis TaxID=159292 RepID=A0A1H3KDE8_9FIRM|nr:hypothetical protein [Tindallia californiensis]SDY50123.1 hypothetical protein SAMN05192546_102316 [Tindallia californiensis]
MSQLDTNQNVVSQQFGKKWIDCVAFFTQVLTEEQIYTYGYQFLHDISEWTSSAIFVLQDHEYICKSEIGMISEIKQHTATEKLKQWPVLQGRVLYHPYINFLSPDFCQKNKVVISIPMIVKDELKAFIVVASDDENQHFPWSEEEMESLKDLMNMSLTMATERSKLKHSQEELNQQIFSMTMAAQCSRMIMAETNLEQLYRLCIDVVREITTSRATAFGLYDPGEQKMKVKGFLSLDHKACHACSFSVQTEKISGDQRIFHIDHDRAMLEKIFSNPEKLKDLDAVYLFLLADENLLGFLTIGEAASGKQYDARTLEQIESITKGIYIAIQNALHIATIQDQKEEIASQLEAIKKFNRMMKNVNSCNNLEELVEITLQTLTFGFNVKQSIFVLGTQQQHQLYQYGYPEESIIHMKDLFWNRDVNEFYFLQGENASEDFVHASDGKEHNGLIIAPIKTDELAVEISPIGYLVITGLPGAVDEKMLLIIQTFANTIAPICKHLHEKNMNQHLKMDNQAVIFQDKIQEYFFQKDNPLPPLRVFYKRWRKKPFEAPRHPLLLEYQESFYFDQLIIVIERVPDTVFSASFDGSFVPDSWENVADTLQNID